MKNKNRKSILLRKIKHDENEPLGDFVNLPHADVMRRKKLNEATIPQKIIKVFDVENLKMEKIKCFLINLTIDVFIQGVLILKFLEIKGKIVENLFGAIPVLMWVFLVFNILTLLVVTFIASTLSEIPDDVKATILKTPEMDKGFFKVYHIITDLSCVALLLLNGLYGCFVLFVILKFCGNLLKATIRKIKEALK